MAGNPNIAEAGRATRFKKSRSGNPGGRPKRKPISDALREELARCPYGDATNAQQLAHTMVERAIAGDAMFAKLVLAYTEGLPTQPVELIRGEAERLAAEVGCTADELIAEAER